MDHEGICAVRDSHLVNDPAAVEVKEARGDTASVIELNVAKEDLGRVIGKAGHTVAALRTILHAVASRMQRRVVLQIVESDENSQPSVHLSVRVPRAGGGGYVCAGGLCGRVRVIHHEEGGRSPAAARHRAKARHRVGWRRAR